VPKRTGDVSPGLRPGNESFMGDASTSVEFSDELGVRVQRPCWLRARRINASCISTSFSSSGVKPPASIQRVCSANSSNAPTGRDGDDQQSSLRSIEAGPAHTSCPRETSDHSLDSASESSSVRQCAVDPRIAKTRPGSRGAL